MAGDQAEAFRFLCGRAAAVLMQLGGGATLNPATPGLLAELEGLHAIATSLTAADPAFAYARGTIAQLELLSTSLAARAALTAAEQTDAKRPRASHPARTAVLGNRAHLSLILEWVGPGHWLLVACTAPRWRAAYMATVAATTPRALAHTAWHTVLRRTRTLLLAVDCGAKHTDGFREALGQWATRDELNCATGFELRLPVCAHMLRGAARGCELAAVKRIARGIRWENGGRLSRLAAAAAALEAARSGDCMDVLQWLGHNATDDGDWPDWLSAALCARAAARGHLATVSWMLSRGHELFGQFTPTDIWVARDVLPPRDALDAEIFELEEGDWEARCRELAAEYLPMRRGQSMDVLTCAADAGHLFVVEFLCEEEDVEVPVTAVGFSVRAGFLDVALYLLRRNRFEFDLSVNEVLVSLIKSRDLPLELAQRAKADRVGQWSERHVSELIAAAVRASRGEETELLQWLRQQ